MLTKRPARGFTLPEALIAIAVMVAGLAGSTAMLLQTVRQERESSNHRAAIRIAASIADQLRAIRRPDELPVLAIAGTDPDAACAGYPASCAPERAAERLRITWAAEAVLTLPHGSTVAVSVPDPRVSAYLISVRWPATGGGSEQFQLPVTT
ncbi:MAG: prepilin-type N-terminal cleavage/methylation domain-containing protein [Gammaproteobacteria bacterium]|nr:prepilin-type N-terminal cleavage/methylation domain-containing protein [Gammaproteobacteria bacterium]